MTLISKTVHTQNYPKLQASLGTQPENTHGIQRETQPDPYAWIFLGNTLGYPWVPTLNFYPWVPEFWVPNPRHSTHLNFLPLVTMGTRLKFLN